MTQLYASVATGTAATLMAITLLLLRLNLKGRRPVVALMRRWVATGTREFWFCFGSDFRNRRLQLCTYPCA